MTTTRSNTAGPGPLPRPMDPRIRVRRAAVRRQAGRRRLRVAVAAVACLAVSVGAWGVLRSPLLAVDRVTVEGLGHTTVDEAVRAAGVARGSAMIDVDSGRAERRLRGLPWVASATVSRSWPHDVRVRVVERVPAAMVPAMANMLALVDGQGRVLVWLPAPLPGVTLLEGLPPAGPPGAVLGGPAGGLLAVAAAVPVGLRPMVATVGVDPATGLRIRLVTGGSVLLGSADDLAAKLRAAELVVQGVDTTGTATLDVRIPATPTITRA